MADGSLIVTDAGLAAIRNAQADGTNQVRIASVGLGSGKYTPATTATRLTNQFKSLSTISGGSVDSKTFHVELRDSSSDAYSVYELGLFLADGTLLAVSSQTATPIIQKAGASVMVMAFDIVLADGSASAVTVGDTNFHVPPATETTSGVAEIATTTETSAGTDDARIVTPKKLKTETDKLVHKTGTETINGLKTFSSVPACPAADSSEDSTKIPNTAWVRAILREAVLAAHPVGSYYMSESSTSPAVIFGGGTWERVKGRMLIGADDVTYTVGAQGGSSTHIITTSEMPSHSHGASTAANGAHSHSAWTDAQGGHDHGRGTMEIWGKFYGHCVGYNTGRGEGAFGGFRYGDRASGGGYGGMSAGWDFYASRHWTGRTTWGGSHGHNVGIGNAGNHAHTVTVSANGGGQAMSILNPYRAVYVWRRTA